MKNIVRKIRALLARADSGRNDNEHEREIAMRQATKLMDMHNISQVEVEEDEDPRGRSEYKTGNKPWKAMVFGSISKLYGCKSYTHRGYRSGMSTTVVRIVGKESYREVVLSMCEYVMDSIEREAKTHAGKGGRFISSFKTGAASGVNTQVAKILRARKAGETTSKENALMVVNHYLAEIDLNQKWLKAQGVFLSKGRRASVSDGGGYHTGRVYGESLSLNSQVKKSGSTPKALS
jgi:hypothetical protein